MHCKPKKKIGSAVFCHHVFRLIPTAYHCRASNVPFTELLSMCWFIFHRGLGLGNVHSSPDVKTGSSLSHPDLLIPGSHISSAVFYPMVLSSIVSRSHGVYGKLLEKQSLGWCLTRCAGGCLWGVRMGVHSFSTLSVTEPSSLLTLSWCNHYRGEQTLSYCLCMYAVSANHVSATLP